MKTIFIITYYLQKMSVNGVYIGYGIEIFLENIEDTFDLGDLDDIEEYFRYNKVWDMNLLVLPKEHDDDDETMYVGAFIKICDDFDSTPVSKETFKQIKLLDDHPFRTICMEKLDIKPKLMTVVVGCSCCT